MKKIFTIVLSVTVSMAAAQWGNTTNEFYDSLHTVVSNPQLVQKNPIVLTSYPDGGYFVIWEDERNAATTQTDIYAQKYDKSGNALWATGGVPIANNPNVQHYTSPISQDYRIPSHAATDSAGGFYIAYSDDSTSTYVWERLMIQHVRSNGTVVFPNAGYRMVTSNVANLNFSSQLIADGNKGFFIAYNSSQYVYTACYRDENGTLKFYGGGKANENAFLTSVVGGCGIKTDVTYPAPTLKQFNIWPDKQAGCNIIMSMVVNGSQGTILAYNRLFRAKKDARVKTFFRNVAGTACPRTTEYVKGDVYLQYFIVRDYQSVACGGGSGPLYTYTNYRLLANGYIEIDQGAYDYYFPQGVTVGTSGNINVDLFAVTRRKYENNILSDFTVQGYAYRSEIFDSIPYQRCTYSNPDFGYNAVAPAGINRLNQFRDTLLAYSNYYPEFSLSAGKSDIYAAALMSSTGSRWVRLQHLAVTAKGTDSFAVEYNSSLSTKTVKTGVAIGRESTASGGYITYDLPFVKVSNKGVAVFSIREQGRGGRVSPINDGSSLGWGAMGKPVGTGHYNNSYYNFEQPVIALDSTGASGLIAWKDNRYIPANNSGEDIYMRHLDKLDVFNYMPPSKRVRLFPNPYGPSYADPAILLGTSKQLTTLEVYGGAIADPGTSPVMDIFDDNYLGQVKLSVFQNSTTIRKYNNLAYLNRNYTFTTDSLTPGNTIGMKLYFTKEEFLALKGADNIIADPGYLSVIRQPNTTAAAPAAYIPVAGEEMITPTRWDSVAGGYTISLVAHGPGNFFLQRIATISACNAAAASFTSNITGVNTYQWQAAPAGSSIFVNIGNNTNYAGTTAKTLQLTNIPTSFNSYRYRCIVDNVYSSNVFYLQVANTWTGAVNNLWGTAGNWSCGTVPDANTDVIISSGSVVISSNAVCRSLKVNPGATLSVAPGFTISVTN